jgi:hypothetical protein
MSVAAHALSPGIKLRLPPLQSGGSRCARGRFRIRLRTRLLLTDLSLDHLLMVHYWWSSVKPARRFNCQHCSFESVQNGFSLP